MSKALTEFAQLAQNVKNAPSKFTGAATEGSRLIPSRTKDALFQLGYREFARLECGI